jgi:hypothetical protein
MRYTISFSIFSDGVDTVTEGKRMRGVRPSGILDICEVVGTIIGLLCERDRGIGSITTDCILADLRQQRRIQSRKEIAIAAVPSIEPSVIRKS